MSRMNFPVDALFSAFGGDGLQRQPMFADPTAGHRYTGPFNTDLSEAGPLGLMAQIGLPMMLGGLMGQHGMTPGQFFPQQNMYDQFMANQYFLAQQQAMGQGAKRDRGAIEDLLGGATRLMTGKALSPQQMQQNYKMAGTVSGMMPILSQILGPDIIEQLHGPRGSATVMAQQIHQAMQWGLDPVTGRVGGSADSAGMMSQEIYERLYGRGANVADMRGVTAGQAGILFGELQARGLAGTPTGGMSMEERRQGLPQQLDSGTIARIAERLPEIAKIRETREPTAAELDKAKDTVRASHATLAGGKDLTAADMDKLMTSQGGQDIIRSGDAKRYSDRLKNLSGAVSAMRDIFGDSGRPNAPMREIINGLEALTQGGLASMSPARVEEMVRRTHSIAKQTGIGVQGMMALTAQGGNLADQLGLDRGLAVQATQGAALYGAAAGDAQRLDIAHFGSLRKEEMTLLDQQLRLTAANSPVNNQLAALLRMQDEGTLAHDDPNKAPENEAQALARAVRDGKTEYDWGGRKGISVAMSRDKFTQIMGDAGINSAMTFRTLRDTYGNQEYTQRYRLQDITRKLQGRESLTMIGTSFGATAQNEFSDRGIDKVLESEGVVRDAGDFRTFMEDVGRGVSQDYFNLDEKTARTKPERTTAMAAAYGNRIKQQIASRMGKDVNDPDVAVAYQTVYNRLGGDSGLRRLATTGYADANANVRNNPATSAYRSLEGMRQMHSKATFEAMVKRERQADVDTDMRSAMSGLGTAGPISRLVEAISSARPDTQVTEIAAKALGGVDLAAIASRDQNGAVAGMLGLLQDNQKLDSSKEADYHQLRRNARIMRGLAEGGELAQVELDRLKADPKHDTKLAAQLEHAVKNGGIREQLEAMGYMASASVGETEINTTAKMGERASTLLGKLSADSTVDDIKAAQAEAGGFVTDAGERSRAILMDDKSLEQLGAGGLDLVRSVEAGETGLKTLAAQMSKKLGRTVTVGELISGGKDIDADTNAEAKRLFGGMRGGMDEIKRRRGYHMMPGKGTPKIDDENIARVGRTEEEKKAAASERLFLMEHGDPAKGSPTEQMAATLAQRMAALADDSGDASQRDMLESVAGKEKLIAAITAGGTDRAVGLHRAMDARDGLVRMARSKGLLGEKATLADEAAAIEKLGGAAFSDTEKKDYERMRKEFSPLEGFGKGGTDAGAATQDAINRIEQFRGVEQPAAAKEQDKKMAITITGGNLTIDEEAGTAAITGIGSGMIGDHALI